MKKVFIVSILTLFLIACSNTKIQPSREVVETQLQTFIETIELQWKNKNVAFLEKNMLPSKRNEYILQKLKKMKNFDGSIRLFMTKPEYSFPKAKGIVGLQYQDRTEYLSIFYEWKQGRWFISTLEERR